MPAQSDRAHADGRFPDHVVRAVVEHLNEDHAEDAVTIVRAFGGQIRAEAAEVLDVDADGLDVAVKVGDTTETVRVRFAAPVTERQGLREGITRLYHAAVDALEAQP